MRNISLLVSLALSLSVVACVDATETPVVVDQQTQLVLRDGATYHVDLTRVSADQVSFADGGAVLGLADLLRGVSADGAQIAELDVTTTAEADGWRIGIENVELQKTSSTSASRCWVEVVDWKSQTYWNNGYPETVWFPILGLVCG